MLKRKYQKLINSVLGISLLLSSSSPMVNVVAQDQESESASSSGGEVSEEQSQSLSSSQQNRVWAQTEESNANQNNNVDQPENEEAPANNQWSQNNTQEPTPAQNQNPSSGSNSNSGTNQNPVPQPQQVQPQPPQQQAPQTGGNSSGNTSNNNANQTNEAPTNNTYTSTSPATGGGNTDVEADNTGNGQANQIAQAPESNPENTNEEATEIESSSEESQESTSQSEESESSSSSEESSEETASEGVEADIASPNPNELEIPESLQGETEGDDEEESTPSPEEVQIEDLEARSAVLIDPETFQVLYHKDAFSEHGVASLSKMVLQYIVLDEINNGELNWDDPIEISDFVQSMSESPELANVPLQSGETYTVEELFTAVSVYSANAATIALAEHLEGSEQAYVERAKAQLEEWGIDSSGIINSSGAAAGDYVGEVKENNDPEAENSMTALDVTVVALHLIHDFPEVLEYASIPQTYFPSESVGNVPILNWNKMLEGLEAYREGVTGLKTGSNYASGAHFAGTAHEDGRQLLSVVLDAENGIELDLKRFEVTDELLDYGFYGFEEQQLSSPGQAIPGLESVSVSDSETESIDLYAEEDVSYLVPIAEDFTIDTELTNALTNDEGAIPAPIQEGMAIGTAEMSFSKPLEFLDLESYNSDNQGFTEVDSIEVPVHAEQSVEELSIFQKISNWFRNLF